MSKRFGRNQKRKLRAAVATLKEQAKMQDGLIEHQHKSRKQLEYDFNRLVTAIEQIAPYSICLNPRTIDVNENYGFFNLAVYPPMDWTAFDATPAPEMMLFSQQKLSEFCVDIEEYRDKFETLVHVYTKDDQCNMHYMISQDVLYTMGLPAEELMKQFTHSWRHNDMKHYHKHEREEQNRLRR